MRAVNLIPAEERRAGGLTGRSNGGALALLGVLAAALVLVTVVTLLGNSADARRTEIAQIETEIAGQQAKVERLQAYTRFASIRQQRLATISSIARSRFDWSSALREVARTTPDGTWLTSLRASVSPEARVEGGTTDTLRPLKPLPAIEVKGCSTGQRAVARLVADLHRIDGVERVSLSESIKEPTTTPAVPTVGPEPGAVEDPCMPAGRPKFSLTVFFAQPAVAAAPAAAAPIAAQGATP